MPPRFAPKALQRENEGDKPCPARPRKRRRRERQHHDERHVVGGDHRQADRCADEGENRRARGAKPRHERTRRPVERARAPQRLNHGEDAEQADKGSHVEVADIRRIRRNRRHARQRAEGGNAQHDAAAREAPQRARSGNDKSKRAHASSLPGQKNIDHYSFSRSSPDDGRMNGRTDAEGRTCPYRDQPPRRPPPARVLTHDRRGAARSQADGRPRARPRRRPRISFGRPVHRRVET